MLSNQYDVFFLTLELGLPSLLEPQTILLGWHIFGILFHLVCVTHVDLLEQRVASHANFLRELLVSLATLESLVREFEEILDQSVIFYLIKRCRLDLHHFVAS